MQDSAGENPHRPQVSYPAGRTALAYVCAGDACFAPVDSPGGLGALLRRAARGERP